MAATSKRGAHRLAAGRLRPLPDDPFDVLSAITEVVEAAGLALSLWLLRRKPATRPGDLALAYFGFTFVLAFTIAAGGHGH